MSAPLLSIVTGTLNRPQELQRLIHSILFHTSATSLEPQAEVIIADASDEPCKLVWRGVRVIHESPRKGHVRGYNEAFKECRGEWVIWLNDDVEITTDGWADSAIEHMRSHPELGLGAFYYSEPPRQPRFHVNFCYGMLFANFGILQRSFGDSIGWFDEDFTMYGSDNSITFRTLLAGRGIGTIPGKFIIHHSTQDEVRLANQHHRKPGSELLRSKYYPLVPQMKAVYSRTAHLVGPKIWVG